MISQTAVGPLATLLTLGAGPGCALLVLVGGILGGSLSQGVTAGYIKAGERANATIACCFVGLALAVFAYANLWHRIEDNFDQSPWQNLLSARPSQRKQLMVAPCPFTGQHRYLLQFTHSSPVSPSLHKFISQHGMEKLLAWYWPEPHRSLSAEGGRWLQTIDEQTQCS